MKTPRSWATALACAILLTVHAGAANVRVEPKETDELFGNPGMGWQTFGMFVKHDKNLQGLPSSSAYFRFYWREIEKEDGKIDFKKLDEALAFGRTQGQLIAFRLMCMGSSEYTDVPMWLKEQGCRGEENMRDGKKHWDPDMTDPLFLAKHQRSVRALAERYDGHPDFDALDIGSVGNWGEWNRAGSVDLVTGKQLPMPPLELQNTIIDQWATAFPKTPKIVLVGSDPGMARAVKEGFGWRADCLGDWGMFSRNWNHMTGIYPQAVAKGKAEEAWKRGPVAFESCHDMRRWASEGYDIEKTLNYALEQHVSYMNNKSAPLPEGARPLVEKFIRKMGYRLVVRSFEHADSAKAGGPLKVKIEWENVGVAPSYRDYNVALRLRGEGGKSDKGIILMSEESIKGWLPGKHVSELTFALPPGLTGEVGLSLGVVLPKTQAPEVKLAIAGRDAGGWYPLSTVKVEAP